MELRPGYKQSDVGVIPDDWDAVPLSQTAKRITRGASPRPIDSPVWFDSRSSVGWVRISDVTRSGRYLMETTQRLSKEGIRRSRPVPSGSLIMSICATVGRPIETRIDTCIHDGFVVFDQPSIDQSYLYHVLAALEPAWSKHGQTGSQMNLNTGLINGCLIPLPPAETEQRAIAQALSDVDTLLATLDQVIAKKRDLKQAAMQQLLTGETRLPGFIGEWETLPAREIGFFKGGSGFPLGAQGETDGEYPFFKVSDMNNEGNETFMTVANHYISEQTRTRLGATAFPTDSIVFAKVGAAVFLERKRILGQASCIDNNMAAFVLDKSRVDVGYIHALLLSKKLSALVTTTALPALNAKQLGEMPLAVPPLPEQSAIAAVLSDIDTELLMLEARRNKTRNLKQAMMQELLTGKTRLV